MIVDSDVIGHFFDGVVIKVFKIPGGFEVDICRINGIAGSGRLAGAGAGTDGDEIFGVGADIL